MNVFGDDPAVDVQPGRVTGVLDKAEDVVVGGLQEGSVRHGDPFEARVAHDLVCQRISSDLDFPEPRVAVGEVGRELEVIADAGYVNIEAIEHLLQAGCEPYVSVSSEDAHNERSYDFRPLAPKPTKAISHPTLLSMREKLATAEGKAIYKLRSQTIETVFGIIKEVIGFRAFLLRGLEKMKGEWELVCLAYNCKRLHKIIQSE